MLGFKTIIGKSLIIYRLISFNKQTDSIVNDNCLRSLGRQAQLREPIYFKKKVKRQTFSTKDHVSRSLLTRWVLCQTIIAVSALKWPPYLPRNCERRELDAFTAIRRKISGHIWENGLCWERSLRERQMYFKNNYK